MNRELLKQALDALEIGAWYVNTEFGDRVELDQCNAAIEALKAELAKPEPAPVGHVYWNKGHAEGAMDNQNLKPGTPLYAAPPDPEGCLSNCDTCTYAWGSPADPGHCFMFYEEPQGVCPKHSEPHQTRNCSRHPDAPHGPDGAGCKCHNWSPGEAS